MPPLTRREVLQAATAATLLNARLAAAASADGSASDDRNLLWYEQPASQWVEALPVGNGRIGAMVFGGLAHERLQLNEDTLWTGGPYDPVNPGAREAMAEVRKLVFSGEYGRATKLVDAKVMARPLRQMSYQSIGDLRLSFPGLGNVTRYRRSLDIDGALARTQYTVDGATFVREVFASAPDDVLVIRIVSSQRRGLNMRAGFHWPDTNAPAPAGLVMLVAPDGDLIMKGRNAAENGVAGALAYEARARLLVTGGDRLRDASSVTVAAADDVTILVAMATSYRGYANVDGDPAAANAAVLDRAMDRSFDELLERHQRDHRNLFRRVHIDLGRTPAADRPTDERVRTSMTSDDPALAALYYQYGRYLLIASSRPGSQPANLQGLWNERLDPPWGSKYTININTQMNYWPAEPTDLSECVEPLVALVRDLSVTGARTAKSMYGAEGWVAHHNTDLWRATAPIDGAKYGMWPTGGAWLCLHLWDRYDYGGDRQYLASVYPLLRSCAQFFLDTLVVHPDGQWLVTNPSMSPENMHQEDVSIAAGPTMDNQILRDLFANTARAATVLARDADFVAALEAARGRLAPDRVGSQGQLQEWLEDWDSRVPDVHHRHVSHLYGLYPSGQISLDHTPHLAQAARRSLELRGDEATGWGLGWRLNLWARLRNAERAHRILKLLLGPERTYPNLFDAHPPFQIDGNFGGTSGITEMLMQSLRSPEGRSEIWLVPALPRAWPAGSITGLRARGGLRVALRWHNSALRESVLEATRSGEWVIRAGQSSVSVSISAGRSKTIRLHQGKLVVD